MITKGIVEEILTNYSIKVRLPILDSIEGTRDATPTSDLSEAIICAAPNSEINFTIGDIVIVGFEDNDDSKPIILGFLSKESGNISSISNNLSKLNVNVSAKLPKDTSIGNVSSQDISMLQGAKFNIQSQLDNSNTSINELEKVVDDLSKSVEVDISKLMPKAGGVFTGEVKFNEVDGDCINFDNSIYINKKNGSTLIGTNGTNAWVGTPDTALTMRGNATRPTYNNNSLALLNDIKLKCDLLFSGALDNGQTITLASAPTYDLLICCCDAWNNTGGLFFVPTSKITPTVDNIWTYGSYNTGVNGSVKGTSAFIKINLNNSTGLCECWGGYDNTQSSEQMYIRKIYGLSLM